jgi:hypothetical protein
MTLADTYREWKYKDDSLFTQRIMGACIEQEITDEVAIKRIADNINTAKIKETKVNLTDDDIRALVANARKLLTSVPARE